MKKIVIFSGTTEGRKLSEQLRDAGAAHIVCVASEYGGEMMREDPLAEIHVGRMDEQEMREFLSSRGFDGEGIIVDATHPYAEEVTRNVRAAAKAVGCSYLRVLRKASELPSENASVYENIGECARALEESEGNILLTTGSKELKAFCEQLSEKTRERLFVRVLPSAESLSLCAEAGIDPRHVIAMHGPFGREMNLATLRQYAIRHLVTKESGSAGGFEDKVRAASDAGAILHVIARPSAEEGIGVEEALGEILGKTLTEEKKSSKEAGMTVTLAGIGMGPVCGMSVEVQKAIEEAEIIFGASRLLRGITTSAACHDMYRPSDIIPVLEREKPKNALILFSGDSGFYSGAGAMKLALSDWRKDVQLRVLPGISSVSALAARTGESYDDAAVTSIHGRKDPKNMHRLMHMIRYHRKTFVLLSGAEDVRAIGTGLLSHGMEARILVGRELYGENECIRELSPEEAASYHEEGIQTALILRDEAERRPIVPVLADDELVRDKVPMTKAAVRHESVLRLGLREGDVVYDVGGGTGSVALEIAAMDPSLSVYVFEKDETALKLLAENKRLLHAGNVTVVPGEAPEAFAGIEDADCVFIGGSGGRLREIIGALKAKKRRIRCVITAVTLETTEEILGLAKDPDVKDAEMIQLQCSPVRELGRYHMMQAQNPVMIFSFALGQR